MCIRDRPTPADIPNLVQYAVLMDRIVTVRASTINKITGVRIVSNPINLFIRIPSAQRGIYTVGAIEPPHGSTLDSATYLTISRDGTNRFIFLDPRSTTSTTTNTTINQSMNWSLIFSTSIISGSGFVIVYCLILIFQNRRELNDI